METRVFDLHCDTLDRLAWPALPDDLRLGQASYAPSDPDARSGVVSDFATSSGHLSLERMARLHWCQCLAVYVPDALDPTQSARFFETVAGTLQTHLERSGELLGIARTPREIEDVLASGKTCGILTIENGKLLAANEGMFDEIEQAGVAMVTLTWNAENPLGSGHDTHHGLTAFGGRVVAELERRHIAVDVSHLNDEGFADVAAIARHPIAASHSNSRAICDVPRNLTDDQFRCIRDSGGVVGLNFCRSFVSDSPDPSPDELLAHVEHWLDLGGEDVIALGSDYDGCDVPSWLKPCDTVARLAALLEERFGKDVTDKILFGNAFAFFDRIAG
jgi:membrane dipeptidase